MLRILHVIPNLEYSGTGRQVCLLTQELSQQGHQVTVCSLGPAGPVARGLAESGAELTMLHWRRSLDVKPLLRLRRLVRMTQPDILHTWGRSCALGAFWLPKGFYGKLVASPACAPQAGILSKRIHGWLLSRADLVFAKSQFAVLQLRRLPILEGRVHLVRPCVGINDSGDVHSVCEGLGTSESTAGKRYLLCAGPFDDYQSYRDTLWAFDILRYRYDDLDLILVGEGSAIGQLVQFARKGQCSDRIHFVGGQPSLRPYLRLATLVWVTRLRRGGSNALMEAMAENRAVVASRLPELCELIEDGVTGFLVPPGDKIGVARRTRSLLNEPDLARAIGQAGRRWVFGNASASQRAKEVLQLYLGESNAPDRRELKLAYCP